MVLRRFRVVANYKRYEEHKHFDTYNEALLSEEEYIHDEDIVKVKIQNLKRINLNTYIYERYEGVV